MIPTMIAHGVFHLALLTLTVLAIVWLVRALRHRPEAIANNDPEELLRRRYATGDITDDEYHQRLAGLHA